MGWSPQELIDRKSQAFVAGDAEFLADLYVAPVPVYFGGALVTHATREDVLGEVQKFRKLLLSEGVTNLTGKVVAQSIPRVGRLWMRVEWTYHRAPALGNRTSEVTYYCKEAPLASPSDWLVEIVEYHSIAFGQHRFESAQNRSA